MSALDQAEEIAPYEIQPRYQYLDDIFLRVLRKTPELMPTVFERFFSSKASDVIPFLSNSGSIRGDLSAILGVPKLPFIRAAMGL